MALLDGIVLRILGRTVQVASHPVAVVGLGGEMGSSIIDDTDAHAGPFKAIVVLEDAVIHADTVGNMENLGGETILAGSTPLYGSWSSLKLTSGKVIAYRS